MINLFLIVLLLMGITALFWRQIVTIVSLPKNNTSIKLSFQTLPVWLIFFYCVFFLFSSILQLFFPDYGYQLLFIFNLPWSFFLVWIFAETPSLSGFWQIYLGLFLGGIIYWGLVGYFLRIIAIAVAGKKTAQQAIFKTEKLIKKPVSNVVLCELCGASNNSLFSQCWDCKHLLGKMPSEEETRLFKLEQQSLKRIIFYTIRFKNIFSREAFNAGILLWPSVILGVAFNLLLPKGFPLGWIIPVLPLIVITGFWMKKGLPKFHGIELAESWFNMGFRIEVLNLFPTFLFGLLLVVFFIVFGVPLGMLLKNVDLKAMSGFIAAVGSALGIILSIFSRGVCYRALYLSGKL